MFSENLGTTQNFNCQKDDMKQVTYCGPPNIRRHHKKKFSTLGFGYKCFLSCTSQGILMHFHLSSLYIKSVDTYVFRCVMHVIYKTRVIRAVDGI